MQKWESETTTIIVDPNPENIAAIRCYEKVGFIRMNTYESPSGKYLLMRYDTSQSSALWNTKKIDLSSAQQLIEDQFPFIYSISQYFYSFIFLCAHPEFVEGFLRALEEILQQIYTLFALFNDFLNKEKINYRSVHLDEK